MVPIFCIIFTQTTNSTSMWKRALTILAAVLMAVPTSAPGETVRLPIVMYHSVTSVHPNDYVLSPAAFEADIRYLVENGYHTVFLSEVVAFVHGTGTLPDKPIVLSFDDGFYNNKVNVLPILRRYNCKACFMVVGEFSTAEIGAKRRSTVYSYLDFDDVREMAASGLAEFGSHTFGLHAVKNGRKGVRRKKNESPEQYRKLLVDDVKKNEQVFRASGVTFKSFAYPYGSYSKETPSILRELGYEAVLTCNAGINTIRRGDDTALFALKRYNRPSKYGTQHFFKTVCGL